MSHSARSALVLQGGGALGAYESGRRERSTRMVSSLPTSSLGSPSAQLPQFSWRGRRGV